MASYLDEGLWRRTKTTSSKGKLKLRLHWLSAGPAQEDGLQGLACAHPPKAVMCPDINSPSRPQAACVYNQLLATLYPLASREYFASTYVPLLLFLKMDLNQDASRNEDEMSLFTEESKKYSLGKMQ